MAGRPSYAQMEKLIEYMEKNPHFAKGQMRCTMGRYQTRVKWEELTNILNSMEGLQKDTQQWTRFWADKKYGIKRRLAAQRNATAYRLRYGLDDEPPPLSDLDDRIQLLVGGKEYECSKKKKELPATRQEEPAEQPKPNISPAVSTKASQTTDFSTAPRRSPRIRMRHQRSQLMIERQRLINIEEKRVAAETVQAVSLRKAVRVLDSLAKAVVLCGQTIAEALNNLR